MKSKFYPFYQTFLSRIYFDFLIFEILPGLKKSYSCNVIKPLVGSTVPGIKRFCPRSNYERETVKEINVWQHSRPRYVCILCWYIQVIAIVSVVRSAKCLTLTLLTWTRWRTPTNASKWRMGFNSAFKGLNKWVNLTCGP